MVPHGRAIQSKTDVLFLKGLAQCLFLKFDHISYRSISANLQSLVCDTSDNACILLFSPPTGERMKRHFTFTVILKWVKDYTISQNNSSVAFSVKYYGRD